MPSIHEQMEKLESKLFDLSFVTGHTIDEDGSVTIDVAHDLSPEEDSALKALLKGIPFETSIHPLKDIETETKYAGTITSGPSAHTSGEPVETVYAAGTFPGCSHMPVHLAGIQLSEIPEFPEDVRALGRLNVVYSNCNPCDSWMLESSQFSDGEMYFRILDDGRLDPIHPEAYANPHSKTGTYCGKASAVEISRKPASILLTRLEDEDAEEEAEQDRGTVITVGGEPSWLQGEDSWCVCPDCDQLMFFVAKLRAVALPPEASCGDQIIYSFVCADCRTSGILMQCT